LGLRGPRRDSARGDQRDSLDQHPVPGDADELDPVVHEDRGTEFELVFREEGPGRIRRDHINLPFGMILSKAVGDLLDPSLLEVLDGREKGDRDHRFAGVPERRT
jgi:hypothetical protein